MRVRVEEGKASWMVVRTKGGYLVADAGLAAGADYYGDGEGGHLLVSGVEAEVEDNLDVGRCL